ncbi:MAG: hypothetical protein DMF61_18045 [Blastocatellia bacterium AA13]|nr:MAG: hypothetical protein DMF61_18045 [Blastocatellia bacterium AA13]
MNSSRGMVLKVWGLLAAVFLLGSLTGAAINGIYRSPAKADGRAPSIRDGEAYLQLLDRELRLDSGQASGMKEILDQTRNEYRGICAEVRPRYDQLRDKARLKMRALLDADQQQRFDTLVTQENCNCPDQKDQAQQPH